MPIGSGLDARFGTGVEVTYGTAVARTRFFEFVTEAVKFEKERIPSEGIRAGRLLLHRRKAGVQRATGPVEMEIAPEGIGRLFEHTLGAVSTVGVADPWVHTFTPGALAGKGLTLELGRPSVDGTVRTYVASGCKITELALSAEVNANLKGTFSFWGQTETSGGGATAPTYPTGWNPFVFTSGSLTSDAAAVDIRSFELTVPSGLAVDRHFIRASNPAQGKEPLEAEVRIPEGTIDVEFTSLVEYNHFLNLDDVTLVLTFDQGVTPARKLVITTEVQFDGETPEVGGREEIPQSIGFTGYHPTSDASGLKVELTNGDAAP